MVELSTLVSSVVFTRNPVVLVIKDVGRCSYTISAGNETFAGTVDGNASVNIGEIIESFVPALPRVTGGELLMPVCPDLTVHNVDVKVEWDGGTWEKSLRAFKGGVSNQNFRTLAAAGSDVFADRFLSPAGNFFLTTRTQGWRIVVKETELVPLYFFAPGEVISVKEMLEDNRLDLNTVPGTLYALDIESVRRKFFLECGVLSNVFEVYAGKRLSCRIEIENVPAAAERYWVLFRNSFGVFEAVDMPGEATIGYETDEDDDGIYGSYDELTDDFHRNRMRTKRRMSITIPVICHNRRDLSFIRDMLASEEVYISGDGMSEIKVVPSTEELSYRRVPAGPHVLSVKFTGCEAESNVMPSIEGVGDFVKPRVFSSEFSKQFN